jgi:transposase-like protein
VILSVTLPGYAQEVFTPMAPDQSALTDLLDALKSGSDLNFMRRAMEAVFQLLIERETTEKIGAGRYERTDSRTTHRGNRSRLLSTKAGDVNRQIPKFRQGRLFPSLLETIADKLGRQSPPSPPCCGRPLPTSSPSPPSPKSHWRNIWSSNPPERVNVEIQRRADVGVFANENSVRRLRGGPDDNPNEVERAHSELVA